MTPSELNKYDHIIVYLSGGKDSVACLLHLIETGADMSKVELWHHDIDGKGQRLMDWPVTPDYCQAIASHLSLPLFFSWKNGGFLREMMRENQLTAPTTFETLDGSTMTVGGTKGKPSTRRKFPQVSADLSVRWCSAYLKIDVASAAIRNQERFNHSRTLTVSGERAEESAARSKYKEFEPDRTDNRNGRNQRHVDRWRPIHQWSEAEVWGIMERHKINPHPAYHLGWGRVSCLWCIFGSDNQCASARRIDGSGFVTLSRLEAEFGSTIHRTKTLGQRADCGTPYDMDDDMIAVAMSESYTLPITVDVWELPAGAFGESCGPI